MRDDLHKVFKKLPRDSRRYPQGRVRVDDPAENTRDHERLWTAISGLRRKANAGGGEAAVSGIQFDTYPQNGEFLWVTTDGDTDFTSGTDMHLTVESSGSSDGLYLWADNANGGFLAIETNDGQLYMSSLQIINRLKPGGYFKVQGAGGAKNLDVYEGYLEMKMGSSGGGFYVVDSANDPVFWIDEGAHINFASPASIQVNAQDIINLTTASNQINLQANGIGGHVSVYSMEGVVTAYGAVGLWLQADGNAGSEIKFYQGSNVVFRIDPDGSIHGPTGGSITWDL